MDIWGGFPNTNQNDSSVFCKILCENSSHFTFHTDGLASVPLSSFSELVRRLVIKCNWLFGQKCGMCNILAHQISLIVDLEKRVHVLRLCSILVCCASESCNMVSVNRSICVTYKRLCHAVFCSGHGCT